MASWRAEGPLSSRACSRQDMVQSHEGPLQHMLSIQARVSGPNPEAGIQEEGPTTA